MSDEPRDGEPADRAPDPGVSGESAPWERPRRWNQDRLEPTRVDDLLARLGNVPAPSGGRRTRRLAQNDGQEVAASDLIASLQTATTQATPADDPAAIPVAPAAVTPAVSAGTPAADAIAPVVVAGTSAVPSTDASPDLATAETTSPTSPAVPRKPEDGQTEIIPRITNSTALTQEIRASLHRESGPGNDQAAPAERHAPRHVVPVPAAATAVANSNLVEPPHRKHRHTGWLLTGRSVAAAMALVVLVAVGVNWNIKNRTDDGLQANSVDAGLGPDSNVVKPTASNTQSLAANQVAAPTKTYATENILLLGSDTRAGGNAAVGTDSSTDGTANSDTIMVAHISADRQHVSILSIPRDTMISAPTCKIWNSSTGKVSSQVEPVSAGQKWHINSAYAVGGPKCTVTAVQELTGLQITRLIGIDFSGFKNMVDALGGITVNVCRPIIDRVLHTVVPTAGVQVIGGVQALNLVRARDVIGDGLSDLARIHRQQVVLSAILRQVSTAGTLLNPAKLDNFLKAFVDNTFTDNVTTNDLVNLAGSLGDLTPGKVTFYTTPTMPDPANPNELLVDPTKAPALFNALVNDLPVPTTTAAPSASSAGARSTATTSTRALNSAATTAHSGISGSGSSTTTSDSPGSKLNPSSLPSVNAGSATCA